MTPGKEETIQRILDVQPPYTTPMKLMSEAYDAALIQSAERIIELKADLTWSRTETQEADAQLARTMEQWEKAESENQALAAHDKLLLQEAFTMIRMLRSFIACGETINKDDDVLIASVLDKLRIAGAQPIPAVSPTRTGKDYAIEHGGYLADAAEAYIDERNKYDALDQVDVAEQDLLNDHFRALNSAIYEFRKRAKRSYNDLP